MTRPPRLPRRRFLELSLGASAAVGLGLPLSGCAQHWLDQIPADARQRIPRRPLGLTGLEVGVLSLGTGCLRSHHVDGDVDAMLDAALAAGIAYWDTSPQYGGEAAETHLGRTLGHRRDEVVLATKTVARDRDGALADLEGSLARLQTDRLDIWQLHSVRNGAILDEVLGPGGAIEAMLEMQEQGVVDHLGITGHSGPAPLLDALGRFPFATALLPLNAVNAQAESYEDLLPNADKNDTAVIGMKVLANGALARHLGDRRHLALRYTAGLDIATMVVGLQTARELSEAIDAVLDLEPLSAGERDELMGAADEVLAANDFYWLD